MHAALQRGTVIAASTETSPLCSSDQTASIGFWMS